LDEVYNKCYDEYMTKFDLHSYIQGYEDLHQVNIRAFNYWAKEGEEVVVPNGVDRVVDKFR
jgi:hypothetical protein